MATAAMKPVKGIKARPYRVLSPRVTEIHLEEELNNAWEDGYELKFVVPGAGPHEKNCFLIMTPRKK
jgi:hypothetical protein